MTINANDDYEKLAKLLYPSIEASGNVYYGQTRKLTMDEILGKNDMGFESHIDSIRVEDDTAQGWHYDTYFIWKLGPFKGSVKVGNLESFPLGYAKYKLVFSDRTVENVTSAGTFPTYKQDCTCEFDSIVYTTTDPFDFSKQWDGKKFYIDDSGSDKYLLVTLANTHIITEESDVDIDEYTRLINTPLCITNIGLHSGQVNFTNHTTALSTDFAYKYSYTNDSDYSLWTDIPLGSIVPLNAGQSIYIKGHRLNAQSNESYFNIGFNGGDNISLEISGNVNSLLDEDRFSEISDLTLTQTPSGYPIGEYTFYKLFYDNGSIVDCSKLLLPANKLVSSCYGNMFYNCELLQLPPELPALNLAPYCYNSMFCDCSSMIKAPDLPSDTVYDSSYKDMFRNCSAIKIIHKLNATNLKNGSSHCNGMFFMCRALESVPTIQVKQFKNSCFSDMFYYCSSLNTLKILSITDSRITSMFNPLQGWLDFAGSGSGCKLYYNSKADSDVIDLISSNTDHNWTLVDIYSEIIDGENNREEPKVYNPKYLTVFGADSDQNGKGKLDGDGDYETSFDERGTHPMNSYNPDGSYNQEIWGYKSFNSPVQFRNGIYCDSYDRVITTHKAGQLTHGENQDVYGEKSFHDDVILSQIAALNFEDDNYINSTCSILPDDASYSLGSNTKYWEGVYALTANVQDIEAYDEYVTLWSDLIPDGAVSLGSADSPFTNIYGNLNGLIPIPDDAYSWNGSTHVTPKIGQIFVAKISGLYSSGNYYVSPGSTLYKNSGPDASTYPWVISYYNSYDKFTEFKMCDFLNSMAATDGNKVNVPTDENNEHYTALSYAKPGDPFLVIRTK